MPKRVIHFILDNSEKVTHRFCDWKEVPNESSAYATYKEEHTTCKHCLKRMRAQ